MELGQIIAPVQSDLEKFEDEFMDSLQSDVNLINAVIQYIARHRGKRMRPALVFLVARMFGNLDDNGMDVARIVELLHTATLIHDDVVDESDMRRGAASVNQIWTNKISILVGDFLFSQVLNKMMQIGNASITNIISRVTTRISEGELLQIQQSQNLHLDEQGYFQMISAKTASLFAAACQIGAIVGSNYSGLNSEHFWKFGSYLGCAFQIQDDLLDYIGIQTITGKPVGNDVKENKITLPLIYAINQNGTFPADRLRELLSETKTDAEAIAVRNLVIESGGVEYAQQRANEFVELALEILSPVENNIYKRSLEDLVQFAAVRTK